MQVTSYRQNQNQTSFGSKRIFSVVVRDMNNMPVKAWFSRLKLSDPGDVKVMEKVNKKWNGNEGVRFAGDIYNEFMAKKPVYAVELNSPANLYNNLLCLAASDITKDKFRLDYLQASPNSSFNAIGTNRKHKGAGTALMYGLVRVAEKSKVKMFDLLSEADGFYKKLGMRSRDDCMTFNLTEMRDFLKRQKTEFKTLSQKQPEIIKPLNFIDKLKAIFSFQDINK